MIVLRLICDVVLCCVFSSIVYTPIYYGVACSAKSGTFGTLKLLLSQEVDVIFGPVCSPGWRKTG